MLVNICVFHEDISNHQRVFLKVTEGKQPKHLFGAQKNGLIETVLSSIHNMSWLRNKKNKL